MADSWALFDRLADGYDAVLPFFAGFAAQLMAVIEPPAGARVLDVGAGRGAVAAAAAARGCLVTAVDAAPRMVALLAAEYPQIEALVMDAHRLDAPDGSFDLVTAAFVVTLVADPSRMVAEMRRVVRPGGTVALTVPGPCADGGRWDTFHRIAGEFEPRAASDRPGRPVDVSALLTVAGFTDILQVPLAVHLPVADPETCWRFHMSHGFAGFVEALAPADAAQLRARLLAELAGMHGEGGIVLDRGAVAFIATAGR